MKIMVFNVAAESSGALSVLNDFYQEVKTAENLSVTWYFIVSKPTHFADTKNCKILRFPWVKKSWFHRLFFDYLMAPRLVKQYKVNRVFSLQNVIVPFVKVPRIVYVHNALPFAEYRYKFRENRLLWVYQNIIKKTIVSSIKKADMVIAQTHWMKKTFVEKVGVRPEKIIVCPPRVHIPEVATYGETKESNQTFFYPATGLNFKNHRVILTASRQLVEQGFTDFKVILTLDTGESDYVAELYDEVKRYNLPIIFVGKLKREEVFVQYAKAVLLFPSFIESYPLPLIEARHLEAPVIAADTPFAHEVLAGYQKVIFFPTFEPSELAEILKRFAEGRVACMVDENARNATSNIKLDTETESNTESLLDVVMR